MSQIYLELLNTDRQEVFRKLADFKNTGYLAGGTALALQIHHRQSFDFDVFLAEKIGNSMRKQIKETFGDCQYTVNTADQITFSDPHSIQITFLWYYFAPLFPLIPTPSLSLASVPDIAADKAMTMGRRAVWRDYVDVYVLLHEQQTDLRTIVENAKKKFGNEFIETQFLEQLTYFADLTITPIEFIGQVPEVDDIQSLLIQTVSQYLKSK